MTDTSAPTVPAPNRIDPAVLRTALTVIVGALAVVFDTTIVSVAINTIGSSLDASLSTIQWVSTGYLLALSVTIPIAGWAQSALGGKRLWILALGIFLTGSILSASAWDAPALIGSRVVQGIGGGIMITLTATLIMQAGGGQNIGKLMAVITVPTSLGPVLGPVLGGVILHFGSWRWLFAVNIPFCVVGGLLALRNLPADRPTGRKPLDAVGFLLLSPGIAAIIYGLTRIDGQAGFLSVGVLAPLAAGVVLVAGFTVWALRRQDKALIDVRLLRSRPLASSSALLLLAGATLYGTLLILPLYLEELRGETALNAGLLLIPQGLGTLLSRSLAGKYTDTIGPRAVATVAFVIAGVATIPFAFATAHTSYALLLVVLLLRGVGLGAAIIPLSGAGFAGLGHDDIPSASILIRVTQQFGGSIGTAVLAVILQHAAGRAHTPAALAHGFRVAFFWSIVFTAAAIPVCLLLPGKPSPAEAPNTASLTDDEVADLAYKS
jgi:EmrB/QacA subfamily drug resistance transporter